MLCPQARLGERLSRFADIFSASSRRYARRQTRRWFAANGLIVVVVSTMMVIAWMLAER